MAAICGWSSRTGSAERSPSSWPVSTWRRVYTFVVHPEVQELQVKLKEILYDCAVDLKATKAALFLFDQFANRFELITEYGFKGTIRAAADTNDAIVDRSGRGRTPFYINGIAAEPRFSEILFHSESDRLLVAPIYLRGQLVGFVDMRDKAGKLPFEMEDLPKAQRVADRVADVFKNKNVFGQRFITLSGHEPMEGVLTGIYSPAAQPSLTPPPPPSVAPPPAAPTKEAAPVEASSYVPDVSCLILEARTAAERVRQPTASETLTEADMNTVREILRAALQIPSAVVAVFSALGHLGGIQEIASRGALTDEAMAHLQSKLTSWLSKHGENNVTLRSRLQTPFGGSGNAIPEQDIAKIFTAPIAAGSLRSLYLSVGFAKDPERNIHELLAAFHRLFQLAIEQSVSRRQGAPRIRVAEKIVEPDFSRYPELRRHSNAVVARTEAFGRFLSMTPGELETIRVVAMVHDAGMRLLDYDRLYRKRDPSPDELNILREHSAIGAALTEPLLGPEIARAVLCHHERWDGRGYPSKLAGEEIPLMSRILQICDVYESMTALDNYQTPLSHEAAMAVIVPGGGIQFDPDLIRRFEEMMRQSHT